ncbi:hypothetical protein [Gemmatimonas sp.]|uniref:hypothetical protein n=1 Tax=Gemmatimonas sp. TaxID=1962908 RepID=UPI0031C34D06|nr:hypothetical protein [Gemmatimonas sp.]
MGRVRRHCHQSGRGRRDGELIGHFAKVALTGQHGTDWETFVLRCVDEATVSQRIRENLREKGSIRMWYNSRETRLFHVRAMPAVMTEIRAEIVAAEEQAPSCTTAPG